MDRRREVSRRGAHRAIQNGREMHIVVAMPPNPSHLEAVDPVVVGMARAAGTNVGQARGARIRSGTSIPVLIHGDSAFPGQGIVAETLNLDGCRATRLAARFTSS